MSTIGSVKARAAELDKAARRRIICSGHGGYAPADGMFMVPQGVTLLFYVNHGSPLGSDVGYAVEMKGRTLNSSSIASNTAAGPNNPTEALKPGSQCYNYRLFPSSDWVMTNNSVGDKNFVTTKDPGGVLLSDVVAGITGVADVHWTACRSIM